MWSANSTLLSRTRTGHRPDRTATARHRTPSAWMIPCTLGGSITLHSVAAFHCTGGSITLHWVAELIVFSTYIYGLPMASVAMSRAAMEQVLGDRLGYLQLDERVTRFNVWGTIALASPCRGYIWGYFLNFKTYPIDNGMLTERCESPHSFLEVPAQLTKYH